MTRRAFEATLSMSLRPTRPTIVRTPSNSSSKSHLSHHSLDLGNLSEVEDRVGTNLHSGGGWSSPGPSPLPSPSKAPPRIGRSRPIAIELPPRKRSGPVDTPDEPLSGRGDLPGGYFPLHEDISRSYKPHPFHPEGSLKLQNNLQTAPYYDKNMPELDSPQFTPLGHSVSHHSEPMPTLRLSSASVSSSIHQANPGGMTTPVQLGKYHPSHYKNVSEKLRPDNNSNDSENNAKHHSRQSSDIRRKLQQYQRDMVEQAALAGRIAMPTAKPTSPRLAPLGSPGPVTPMALEESGGYLLAGLKGRSSLSPGADEPRDGREVMDAQEMVRRMIKAEEDRDRERTMRGKVAED